MGAEANHRQSDIGWIPLILIITSDVKTKNVTQKVGLYAGLAC
jgi:hypothetical protein